VTTNVSSLGTLRYDLGTGNSVLMDASLTSGSGEAGVLLSLAPGIIGNAASTDAVYVYAAFGGADATDATGGGFEEFLLIPGNTNVGGGPVPEPASLALLPMGIGALALRLRKSRSVR